MASLCFGSQFLTPGTKQIITKSSIKHRIGVEFLLHSPVYFYFCCIIRLSHSFAAMCVCHMTSQENFWVTDHVKVVFVKWHNEQMFSVIIYCILSMI